MRSRRELMQLLGLAPVIASSATSQLAALMASPAVVAASSLASGAIESAGYPESAAGSIFGKVLGRKLEDLRTKAEREMYDRRALRIGGVDPDIAAIRATSFSYKAQKQCERDIDEQSFLIDVGRKLWG